jgi:membrane protease YdiL (CAAX protease family)
LLKPKFQVTATWVWNLVGTFALMAGISILLPENFVLDKASIQGQPSLTLIPILSEILLVGLLPIIFSILMKEKPSEYGVTTKHLILGLGLAAGIVLVYFAYLSLLAGHITTSVILPTLYSVTFGNVLLVVLGFLAYGPLEVFFVIWLIHNTDRIFKSESRTWSWGLIITVCIYALLHAFSQGANSIVIALEMLAFGLVYKRTGNSIGSMIAFMFMNGYAWFLASALLA